MNPEKIEDYVANLLNISSIIDDEEERPVRFLLHHLYCAVAAYELMDEGGRALIKGMMRRLKYFFRQTSI